MEDSQPEEDSLLTRTPQQAEAARTPPARSPGQTLKLSVLYTTHAGTLAALKMVSKMRAELDVEPRILIFYVMPWTLPLDKQLIPSGLLAKQIHDLALEASEHFSVRVYLCRNPQRSLRQILPPHSLIVIGGKRRWWPSQEQRLAKKLEKEGHDVIFVDWG